MHLSSADALLAHRNKAETPGEKNSVISKICPATRQAGSVCPPVCLCHVLLCWPITSQTPELSHLSQKFTLLEWEIDKYL